MNISLIGVKINTFEIIMQKDVHITYTNNSPNLLLSSDIYTKFLSLCIFGMFG